VASLFGLAAKKLKVLSKCEGKYNELWGKKEEEGKPKDFFAFLRSYLNVIQLSLLNIKVMP
jgi:hypothetical protein